ncbi:hypothetical protein HPB51_022978 [Rhipicephalus microplus]|uniref:Uncharacterized protein n=1 Tax=Rhipicephalus microplus TaxID=6941 RepID=A0A9J6DCM4_RHIMP|nr:hypothetical protein HPB51_022978 [Rhipicephalus microplus]
MILRCVSCFHDQMDPTTPATKSNPPLQQTCRYNHGGLPPVVDYRSFLEDPRRYYGSASKTDEVVLTSTSDAAARYQHGCLEHQDCASFLGPQRVSSTGKVAIASRRDHVTLANTRRFRDADAMNSEPSKALTRHLSKEGVSSNETRAGRIKSRSQVTSADDVGTNSETPKPKTQRFESKESHNTEPMYACEISTLPQVQTAMNSKRKKSGAIKVIVRGQPHRAPGLTIVSSARLSALRKISLQLSNTRYQTAGDLGGGVGEVRLRDRVGVSPS